MCLGTPREAWGYPRMAASPPSLLYTIPKQDLTCEKKVTRAVNVILFEM